MEETLISPDIPRESFLNRFEFDLFYLCLLILVKCSISVCFHVVLAFLVSTRSYM
jgi:hypothetical protein